MWARSHKDTFGQWAETWQGQGSALDNGRYSLHNWGGTGGGTNTAQVQAEHSRHWQCIENEPQRAAQGCSGHSHQADGKAVQVGGKSSGRLRTHSHGMRAGAEGSHCVGAGVGTRTGGAAVGRGVKAV
ncbi:hypothetical protein B0H13DRAFT_1908634 [Mycena leptocephala]|nr:hypothetical protein B0H13DRAFT_1908634 [Mycena leptocephala]